MPLMRDLFTSLVPGLVPVPNPAEPKQGLRDVVVRIAMRREKTLQLRV